MRTNGHNIPVIALDIDGTLGDYHGHFLRFAEGYLGRDMPDPLEINPGLPLWKYMGVEKREYADCKLAYRQGGMKRTMPVYAGADELTAEIQSWGWEVWICTTRPYLRLDNIDPDTREWLRRNGIRFDAVLFDNVNHKYSKYRELARQANDRVLAVFDDLPEAIVVADELGFNAILRNQPYNRHLNRPRVNGCLEMLGVLKEIHNEYTQ